MVKLGCGFFGSPDESSAPASEDQLVDNEVRPVRRESMEARGQVEVEGDGLELDNVPSSPW
jgi:hypothetical protein